MGPLLEQPSGLSLMIFISGAIMLIHSFFDVLSANDKVAVRPYASSTLQQPECMTSVIERTRNVDGTHGEKLVSRPVN